ncbi:OmpA family protein, partial [Zooshikella harenae]
MANAVFKLPVLYLVSADFDTNGNIIKNSLQPIPDTLFVTRRTSAKTNQDETVLWTTNYQGYVNLVRSTFIQGSREGKLFEHNQKIHIFFPNPRVISNIYCEHGEKNFIPEVQKLITEDKLKQPGSSNQVTILCDLPKKEYMRDPDDVDEDWYTEWYESVGDDYEVKAIVVPKVEVLIISFSDDLFKDVKVELWPHQSKFVKENIVNAKYGGDNVQKASSLIINTQRKQKIQEGLYNIRITLSDAAFRTINSSGKKHTFQVDEEGLFYYELKENIAFAYKTPTADFCLINGDPIHLEEAMLKQFPDILKDVVKATRDLAQGEGGETDVPAGLNAYMHDINLRHDYSQKIAQIATVKPEELAKGLNNKSRISAAKDILHQFLVDEQYYHTSLVMHIALESENLLGNYDALKKAYELKKKYDHFTGQMNLFISLAANPALNTGTQNVLLRLANNLDTERRSLNQIREAFDIKGWFNPRNTHVLDDAKKEYAILAKLGIPPRLLYVGMRAMAAWGVFSGLFDVYEEYKLLSKSKKQARKTVEDYESCVLEYRKAIAEDGDPNVHKAEQQLKKIAAKTNSYLPVKRIFRSGVIELRANIRFGLDDDTTDDIPVADIVELVNNQPKAKLTLHGHACPLGSDHYNMMLSKKRVDNIRKVFIKKGIQTKKVDTDFSGESYPINKKNGSIFYEESRRVEVCVALPDAEFIFRPSREAMQVLEKYRFAQVNSAMGLEEQQQKMLMAVFNAGVGMAALVPQFAVVTTAIMVLPTAAKSFMTLAEYIDRTAFDSVFTYWLAEKRLEDQLDKRSKYNQRRIDASPDPSEQKDYIKYLNNQYRIRAEVLTALLKLLMRASYRYGNRLGGVFKQPKTESDQALADQCLNELRIKEFIDLFVLNAETWHYPHLVNFDYNLDQFWMDCLDMKDVWDPESWQQQSSTHFANHPLIQRITEANQRAQSATYPYYSIKQMEGGSLSTPTQTKPSDVHSKYFIPCTFQQCFPIHAINSENLSVLMHNFDLNYARLNNDIYKFTAMYVRPYGALASDKGADKPWMMMEEYLKTHDGISPLDQV